MRTPITLKIKFKSSTLDQFIERYSVDVSRGGIFIRTKEPLPVGTQLRFEFQLQDASSLIAGDGTVVWIREHDPARQGVAPGMGVPFDKLAADSQKVLDKILAEKQKRGDAQLESRFDAGVRASASASGTLSSSPQRVAGHNDFSGGDSRSMTPLPGAGPGGSGGRVRQRVDARDAERARAVARRQDPRSGRRGQRVQRAGADAEGVGRGAQARGAGLGDRARARSRAEEGRAEGRGRGAGRSQEGRAQARRRRGE